MRILTEERRVGDGVRDPTTAHNPSHPQAEILLERGRQKREGEWGVLVIKKIIYCW